MHRSTSPSTVSQEKDRHISQAVQRPAHKSVRRQKGKVLYVHPSVPQVKILLDSGRMAKGGGWIPVMNPPSDIALRFGTLRQGLLAIISHTSDLEKDAYAEIIGEENNILGNTPHQINQVGTGLYEIFTPGSPA